LKLTIACDGYDYLAPLKDREVEAEGIDLNLLTVQSGTRHERMFRYGEYDACEFSMSSYLVARGRDIDWFQAIPFFPRRMFGHKFCFIRAGSGFGQPADLQGCRIGLRSYENTLALMVKGMLMHDYGLPVEKVNWVCVNKELVGSSPPDNIRIDHLEEKRTLADILLTQEVEAEVEPDLPSEWLKGEKTVERLFPDFEAEERSYYKKTRIFPIMHTVVIKEHILEQAPWVAVSMLQALQKSKELCYRRMRDPRNLALVWVKEGIQEQEALFGPDPWPYNLEDNRAALEAVVRYEFEQGMVKKKPPIEDLFFPPSLQGIQHYV
ncbi:MAG: ABC transporter substrate-binding protein, partial [Candidatus Binatia bacterium]|nr:ABC transporter substrate-binding protein [Candidatus Binatia bacterium]